MRVDETDRVAALVGVKARAERVDTVHALLARSGVILRGHFELQSKKHSEYFFRGRGFGTNPELLDALVSELMDAVPFAVRGTTILCPESAGLLLGDAIARANTGCKLAVVRTDFHRRPTTELRTGCLSAGTDVVIVNDVATTGASLEALHEAARVHGARARGAIVAATVGAGPLIALNRLGLDHAWLVEAQWPLHDADACPLCSRDVPLLVSAEFG